MEAELRAYLVDPHRREVELTDHDDIAAKIGAEGLDRARLGVVGGVVITAYVDDGGYYVGGQAWWRFTGASEPFAGRVLVTGTDYMGETVDCPVSARWLLDRVTWLGSKKPRLPPIIVHTPTREHVIDLNAPDAPKSKEEVSALVNRLLSGLLALVVGAALGLATVTCGGDYDPTDDMSDFGGGKRSAVHLVRETA